MASFFSTIGSFFSPSKAASTPQPSNKIEEAVPIESNNFLDSIQKVVFRTLSAMDYEQRQCAREQIAKDILKRGENWKTHVNWRQFALMHCPGIIRETTLEGGQEVVSACAALGFLNSCLCKEGLFFSVGGVPRKTFLKLLDSLFQYRTLLSYRPAQTEETTSKADLEQCVDDFLEKIQSFPAFHERGVYLPLGYRHGTTNQGHSIACKIKEDKENKDVVILTLFNLGNGSDSHPILNYSLNQKKTSFSFFPIRFPKEHFFKGIGKTALCRVFRYLADAPKSYEAPYDGHDIYDIFLQFTQGSGFLMKLPKKAEYEADSQISGNCPEIAKRCIMEDVLIQEGVSIKDRGKIFLNQDFCSLIAHYHAFLENPSCHPSARELLQDAAKSFGKQIIHLHEEKQISEQEFIGAQAAMHEIVKTTEKAPYPPNAAPQGPATSIDGFHRIFQTLPSLSAHHQVQPKQTPPQDLEQIKFEPPICKCFFDLPSELKKWIATAANLPKEEAFQFVSDCIRQIPLPFDRDKVPNGIPPKLIPEILADLEALIRQGLRGVRAAKYTQESSRQLPSEQFVEQFMMIGSAYVIADMLARLCEDSKLTGYASPFLPHPFVFEPMGFTSLPLREDNEHFSAIFQYFTGKKHLTDEGHQDKTIFPIGPVLNVQQFVSDILSQRFSKETEQGKNHVAYLARLLPTAPNATETDLASYYSKNWMKILPPQVQSLYYFSFLCNTLFSAPGMVFPSSLSFSSTSVAGKTALKIENPFFTSKDADEKARGVLVGEEKQIALFGEDHKPKLEKPIHDRRFESFQTNTAKFIDLNSPEMRALKTNEAICYMLAEKDQKNWSVDESTMRTVLYDTRKGNLSLWQSLQDFSSIENHFLLSHPGIQNALDGCFFQPRFLLERLQNEPESLTQAFRAYVSEGLRNYNNNHTQLDGILFLLRQGICFEGYLPFDAKKQETLNLYQKTLDDLFKGSFYSHQWADIYSHLFLLDLQKPEALESTLHSLFLGIAHYYSNWGYSTWPSSYLPRLIRQTAYRFYPTLKDPQKRDALCDKIIDFVIPDRKSLSLPSTGWEGDFPQYSRGDIVIDFMHGTIANKKYKGVLTRKSYDKQADRELGIPRGKHGELFWIAKNGEMTSLNGKLKYCPTRKKWYELIADLYGQLKECEITSFDLEEAAKSGQEFLSCQKDLPFVHYKLPNGSVLIYESVSLKPYLIMEFPFGDTVLYTRLDSDCNKLPISLSNLSELRPSDPLYRYTARFAHPAEILCFVDDIENRIQELNFYKLGLKFETDGNGLAWHTNPEFYLIADKKDLKTLEEQQIYAQLRREINDYEGAMVLYNPSSKKWNVLFPISDFTKVVQEGQDFSRDIRLNKSRSLRDYFHFEFDPIEKSLRTLKMDHDRSNAYLAVLYKMQRDYSRAQQYLNQVKTTTFFNEETLEMLDHFTDISDFTPASVAFNLKYSLFRIRNKNLMLEKQFSHQPATLRYRNFLRWSMDNYNLYLSEKSTVRIPEKMSLSDGEKMMLVLAYRRSYQENTQTDAEGHGWEYRWAKEQPILNTQYNVFFSAQGKDTLLARPQEISVVPPIFASVKRPDQFVTSPANFILKTQKECSKNLSAKEREEIEIADHPIRVTEKAIAFHFRKLYEEARKCEPLWLCDFDFTLQALLKTVDASQQPTYLGHLLFWVRHFPLCFDDCPLGDPLAKEEIDKIYQRVKELPRNVRQRYLHLDYAHVADKLKQKVSLYFHKDIPLSVPRVTWPNTPVQTGKPAKQSPVSEDYLQQTEEQIYRLFNSPFKVRNGQLTPEEVEEETRFLFGKDSSQILSFSKKDRGGALPETLMKEVILKNNLNYLRKHRPMLKVEQMQELCRLVNEWYHTRVLLKLVKEGNQGLYIPYDYQEYPEISHYFVKSGKFPWAKQIEDHLWIIEQVKNRKKCHLQRPTGGGKTDVTGPLLNLAAKRLGLMPVNCVTQAIYPVDKENLSYNLRLLGEDLCYLEVGMHMTNQLSGLDLEFIFSQLMQYKSEGKSLIITRHTYDALFLICDLVLKNGAEDPEASDEVRFERGLKIRFAENILYFFENSCLLICDESHQNADPLTRAIFGTGELSLVPEEESSHLQALIECLRLLEIPTNETQLKEQQKFLAKTYLAKFFPEIPQPDRQAVLDFWTDKTASRPEGLKTLAQAKETRTRANLIALTSHFLLDLLPNSFDLYTDVDHARSLYPQKKYEVPATNKLPSTAEYGDRYKTCVLTIKGNYGRGLYEDDIRLLLTDMLKACEEDKKQGFKPENAPSNERFREWLEETDLKDKNPRLLEDIQFSNPPMMSALHTALKDKRAVVDYFLAKYGFAGIGTPTEQLSCTTTDFFNGFYAGVSFSATPRDKLSNPRCIKSYLEDTEFKTKVKAKWKESQNRTVLYADNEEEFFLQLLFGSHKDKTIFLDPRGFFTSPSHVVAKNWLEKNESLNGVLYFNEARSTNVDREEKVCLLSRDGKVLRLNGSNIQASLKEHNLDWEKLNLGTFYGPGKTESANILQKPNAKACLFIKKGLTTSHAIQTLGRCRGFTNLGQTVTTLMSKNLAKQIFVKDGVELIDQIHDWTDKNEEAQEEMRIVLNAYQDIHHVIARSARAAIKAAHAADTSRTMKYVIAVYLDYADGLKEVLPADAYEAYGEHEIPGKTRTALQAYALETHIRFKYTDGFSQYLWDSLKDEIEEIISDVEKRIPFISTNPVNNISKQVDQNLHLKTQIHRQQQKVRPRPVDPLALEGEYGSIKIFSPEYLTVRRTSARDLFQSDFLSNNFCFEYNHLHTAKLSDLADSKPQFLKPIHYFMILLSYDKQFEHQCIQAVVVAPEILAFDLDGLMSCPEKVDGLEHTALLVTASGKLVQRGCGALEPPKDLVSCVLKSPWFEDLIQDAALVNGKITNPDNLIRRIKATWWETFETLWKTIVKALPNDEKAQERAFEKLKERYFREKNSTPSSDGKGAADAF